MKLYHFTTTENLWLISLRGLEPYASDNNVFMTMGEPVVWLTRQETNVMTAEHAGHPDFDDMKIGEPMFGGPVRLTVNIERHNKRLQRYPDFCGRVGLRTGSRARSSPAALTSSETFRTESG